jgi:hypothetical protein
VEHEQLQNLDEREENLDHIVTLVSVGEEPFWNWIGIRDLVSRCEEGQQMNGVISMQERRRKGK